MGRNFGGVERNLIWAQLGAGLGLALLSACGPIEPSQDRAPPRAEPAPQVRCERAVEQERYASKVLAAKDVDGRGYGNPQLAVNGVRGGGLWSSGLDVFSLNEAKDGQLIIGFDAPVCDGPGNDLAVFENPFRARTGDTSSFEPVIVAVSADGVSFFDLPHAFAPGAAASDTERAAAANSVTNWTGFAGLTPVLWHEETNGRAQGLSVFAGPAISGGDHFDLASITEENARRVITRDGIIAVRLTAAPVAVDSEACRGTELPCPNFPNVRHAFGGYGDIDGVYGRYRPEAIAADIAPR